MKDFSNLESADIVVISIQGSHGIKGLHFWVSGPERNTEADISLDSVWAKHAEVPAYEGSPVMSHKEDLVHTQKLYKRNQITHNVKAGVAAH